MFQLDPLLTDSLSKSATDFVISFIGKRIISQSEFQTINCTVGGGERPKYLFVQLELF